MNNYHKQLIHLIDSVLLRFDFISNTYLKHWVLFATCLNCDCDLIMNNMSKYYLNFYR